MIRKIDELGRIVLPAEMRSKLHLEKEDAVSIECVNDKIILSKQNQPVLFVIHQKVN